RMIAASPGIVRRFRAKEEAEIIGKSDYDFFPAHLADRFVADDRKVLASGKPLTNRVEIWFTDEGLLDWFVTNKLPIFGPGGALIGVMGTVTNFDGQPLMDMYFDKVCAMV
ncbi:MAG: PAS domain-containing protein, partial [Pirellulaceae bacterium]